MSFQVARNIDMVREVTDYFEQDPLYDRDRDEDDQYADSLDDEAFERDAMAVWDAVKRVWVDV